MLVAFASDTLLSLLTNSVDPSIEAVFGRQAPSATDEKLDRSPSITIHIRLSVEKVVRAQIRLEVSTRVRF